MKDPKDNALAIKTGYHLGQFVEISLLKESSREFTAALIIDGTTIREVNESLESVARMTCWQWETAYLPSEQSPIGAFL